MSITGIIMAAVIVGGTGLFIGAFLGIAGKKFAVEVDEREEAITGILPGNNCGGCGYAGCSGLAAAIVEGKAEIGSCPVGGAPVATLIGEIMEREAGEQVRMTAFVKCAGTCDKANQDYKYFGIEDCKMMDFVQNGGPKSCNYGCHGFGTCVKACPFDAIHVVDGVAVVDKEACKACGKCVAACPKNLIELVPYSQKHLVQCSSKDKGKDVMSACKVGCIGCKMCQKVCPSDAITVENNIAHIDPEKCTNCGACAEKCPKKNYYVIKKAVQLIWQDIRNMKLAILVIAGYLWFNRTFLNASCIFVLITGFPCPGCGLTRAGAALLKGDFCGAFEIHPFIYAIVILLFFFCIYRYILRRSQKVFVKWAIVLIIGMFVFYIYRMVSVFPGEPPMSYYSHNLVQAILNTFFK